MRKPAVLLMQLAVLGAVVVAMGAAAGVQGATSDRLHLFRSCAELVDYAKGHASKIAGSGGIVRSPGVIAPPSGAAEGPAGAATDYSMTNVQEEGVDEPDMVKTDGARIFAIAAGKLHALDARSRTPRLLDSVKLAEGWRHELLLYKGRILVLSVSATPIVEPPAGRGVAPFWPTETVLSEIDAQNPEAMRVVRTLTIKGAYLTARLVGSIARVVIASTPQFPPVEGAKPTPGGQEPSRAAIASSDLETWVPFSVLQDRRTGRKTKRALVQCRAVGRPPLFSGVGLVTVVTIDLAKGLPPVDSDAVMMGGGSVYASAGALYVASQRWLPLPLADGSPPTGMMTEIHKFAISKAARTDYQASGAVAGFLLNQWSLSEDRGYLRVASTEVPVWSTPPPRQETESFVSVLAERGGKLVQVGRVGELGRGERVYAVRFIGDVGFVVTFRQVDPLYTIDLGNPPRPSVLGALKVRGYSAYLHPVGRDLLLGVGQDATEEGRVLGTQLSLFDVSNLRRPARLDALPLGASSSEVEYDPHAFLFWPARALAVLPVQIALVASSSARQPFAGAIAVRVARKGIERLGRITHPGDEPVRRSIVVGDRLYTVSERGIKANSLATLADVAWVPFT